MNEKNKNFYEFMLGAFVLTLTAWTMCEVSKRFLYQTRFDQFIALKNIVDFAYIHFKMTTVALVSSLLTLTISEAFHHSKD